MKDWTDESIGKQLYLTSKSARVFFSRRLAEAGSSFGVWTILASLHAGAPLIQRELAARLSIESPTLTRYLAQMEADGLLTRGRSASDRRAATIELTKEGRARYRKLAKVALESHALMMAGFTDEEIDDLREKLHRIRGNVEP